MWAYCSLMYRGSFLVEMKKSAFFVVLLSCFVFLHFLIVYYSILSMPDVVKGEKVFPKLCVYVFIFSEYWEDVVKNSLLFRSAFCLCTMEHFTDFCIIDNDEIPDAKEFNWKRNSTFFGNMLFKIGCDDCQKSENIPLCFRGILL